MAGLGGDVGVWRGVRWKVAGCSGSRGAEVGQRRETKEVNRSDLFWLRLFCSIWDGMGGNGFAVNIGSESVALRVDCWKYKLAKSGLRAGVRAKCVGAWL